MSEHLTNDPLLSMEQRIALLKTLPVFAMLSGEEYEALATMLHDVTYPSHYTWMKEDDLVDSVYLIVSGQVEVSRHYTRKIKILKKKKIKKVPIAVLNAGDTIGLSPEGFYSQTGKRTATVTTLTEIHALGLSVDALHDFFKERPHLKNALSEHATQIMRVQLIKQSLPFSRLSHERLCWLADQIKEASVPAGTIILQQGELGEHCYLIRSGKVEVFIIDENQNEQRVSILRSPTLFGEATLITRSPRNATARALEDCELLVLNHQYLYELIETEKNVAHMFMNLMVDRSRPLKNSRVTAHRRTTADKQTVIILKNPDNSQYFKLSPEGWFIWEQLDGKKTMQEITLSLANEFNLFAPDVVSGLISKLAKAGFVSNIRVDEQLVWQDQPIWVKIMQKAKRLLEARVAIGDANKWITLLYQKGGYLLFTRLGKIILLFLIVSGLFAFGFSTGKVMDIFQSTHHSWILFVLLIPFTLLSVGIHELGHALTTKAYGHEVNYMGIGWYWFGPVAFVDTSDMWLSTRWPRIMVNLAGILTDLLVGSVAALLVGVIPNLFVQGFLWVFALFSYINAFRMTSPLQELDGYYILMDLFERPHLRHSAVKWLLKYSKKTFRSPHMMRAYLPEISYWLACLVFLICVTLLTLGVQAFIFHVFHIQPASALFSLAIPFIVVFISSLGIIADLRSQSD